jgi:hypothetical protein
MTATLNENTSTTTKPTGAKAILKMGLFPLSVIGGVYALSITILLFALGGISALPGVLTFLVVFGLLAMVHFFRIKRALQKTSKKI